MLDDRVMGGVGGALKDCWVGRPKVLGGRRGWVGAGASGGNYLSKQYIHMCWLALMSRHSGDGFSSHSAISIKHLLREACLYENG